MKKQISETINIEEKDFYNFKVLFSDLDFYGKEKSLDSAFGLWKIESDNLLIYDYIRWNTPYRFRHILSGKYLNYSEELNNTENIENKKV